MTISALHNYGREALSALEEGVLEARLLLEYTLSCDRHFLLMNGQTTVTEEQKKSYEEVIVKRLNHIPIGHIMGYENFYGYDFLVSEDTLIPRNETEVLVSSIIDYIKPEHQLIVDVGTGTGCIPISVLLERQHLKGVAIDISTKALEVAKKNGSKHQLEDRLTFCESNLFSNLDDSYFKKIDVLVSNPPYIPTSVVDTLEIEVKDHEPKLALDGGLDGLDFYREIIEKAPPYMKDGGLVIFEIGHDQSEQVMELFKKYSYSNINYINDLLGVKRIVYANWVPDN